MKVLGSKWVTLGALLVAGASLWLAVTSLDASRRLRDEWRAFQTEVQTTSDDASLALLAASGGLAVLADEPLTVTADISEDIPIRTSIPFERELQIPIQTSIPINETIETTIQVAGPFGWEIPVTVQVPVDLDVPIDLSVPITVSETIDVDTTTHVELSVPVRFDLDESGLGELARTMSGTLADLAGSVRAVGS